MALAGRTKTLTETVEEPASDSTHTDTITLVVVVEMVHLANSAVVDIHTVGTVELLREM